MSTRVLLLSAGFGEGHNAAARALAEAADEVHGPGSARVIDVFALARPRTNALVRRGYLALINGFPGAWRLVYAWLDRSALAPRLFAGMRRERRVLGDLIAAERPDVLCSTYPLYAYLLASLARSTGRPLPPHFNVVTDSISINSVWWRATCDGWFVPNEDSTAVVRAAGVSPDRVHTLGFPVARFFADQQGQLTPPPLSTGTRPRVLYIINSGTKAAAETARRLLVQEEWDVTCTVGRNEALRAELTRLASQRRTPAQVLGWTNQIPRLLMTHHVVVSKAGGATTQEAIAACCPMVVNQIVPGQEEGNYELLRRHGIGALAQTPDAIIATLRDAFASDAARWRRWRHAVGTLSRPNAAREILRAIHAVAPADRDLEPLNRKDGENGKISGIDSSRASRPSRSNSALGIVPARADSTLRR